MEAGTETDDQMQSELNQMRVNGWCVVRNVVPQDRVAAVRARVMDAVHRHANAETLDDKGIGHVSGFVAREQSFAPYVADSRVMGVVYGMLGDHARISFTTATVNFPGNPRGVWHADWPFNQNNAGHISAPYPDAVMHLTTLWMLSPFSTKNGGTLILPGSHRSNNNPSGENGFDPLGTIPGECNAVGEAGSVLMLDSRLWHATAPNRSDEPRASVVIRYAPWWLDTGVLMPGSEERKLMLESTGLSAPEVPPVPLEVYDTMHEKVKPLFRHWVRSEN